MLRLHCEHRLTCQHIQASLAHNIKHYLLLDTENDSRILVATVVVSSGCKDGGDREPHRPAGNEDLLRAHCRNGCRAAREQLGGPVADVDQRDPTTQAHAQLTGLIDTKVWRKIGKLDAPAKSAWDDWELGRVDLHRTVGQESDERHDELSSVGNSCHKREFARRPGAGQLLSIAHPAHYDHPPQENRWTSLAISGEGEASPEGLEMACPGVSTSERKSSWSDAEAARVRVQQ